MKKIIAIIALCLCFDIYAFAKKPQPIAGPNCHIINSAKSTNSGKSYKKVSSKLLKSASVPDAVIFKNKKLIYYVNGDFDNHSIYVSEVSDDIKTTKIIGPIKLNGEIDKNAVDPDLIVTEDGKIRLFYYVGLFTRPVMGKKPNKFYSAISDDGINFKIEGVVAVVDNATDPTVVKIPNGDYLFAVAQGDIQNIEIFKSSDGYKFNNISSIKGGIPELSVAENGDPELLFQDSEGILKLTSTDGGKKWKKIKRNVLSGNSKGSASPSVVRINEKERIMFYFKVKKGCSTPPTAYLEDKNALGSREEMGEPPLGDGVKPKKKIKKKN